jgi:predicted GIY-YIG superfamily endonuclease
MKCGWVYILLCSDGSYYTGCSSNLEKRIFEHQTGLIKGFTSTRLPVKLVFSEQFDDIQYAIQAERQIKGWSRKKKMALIKGDFKLLSELAQSKEMIQRRKKRQPS